MAIEFEVSGHRYRAEKLDAFEQWDVTRRLLPVVGGAADILVRLFKEARNGAKPDIAALLEMDIAEAMGPFTKALSAMSDDDSRFVLATCLKPVTRLQQGGVWAPVTAPNGALMFVDIDMPTMLQIVWKVIEANLLNFSSALPAGSSAAAQG